MQRINPRWSFAAVILAASTLSAQTKNLAQRLGYPADAKLVIIHADDLAVAHSVDVASLDALDRGAITSASIMMPTPWVTEVAAYAKTHPNADLGLHLTLTAEWATYKWGSVESRANVSSLLDSAGVFPSDVAPVAARAKPAEVERELRAQVDRALAMGIRPTHLDSHMGTLFATPEMFAAYVKVAREYKLPFLAGRAAPLPVPATALPDDILVDALVIADENVPRDQWKKFYLDAIANLKPGLTYLIVHLGRDDAELQAVTVDHEPYGSAWRQRDYEVVTSPEFRKALADNHVIPVTWRQLQQALPAQAQPRVQAQAQAQPSAKPKRPILAVFAHPDDERVIGPLLSRLAREGRETHLIIATDGSQGVRDFAKIPGGAALAAARVKEANCAAKRLGVKELHIVGLPDGGLASFESLGKLRPALASIIDALQPAAIITFGPEGGTGHPDHRLVGDVVTQVVQGDARYANIDLLYASLPSERLRTAPPAEPTVNGMAEALLTVRVPFEDRDLVAGREEFACHASQYTPTEMAAVNRYLAHAWNGTVWLRPWTGTLHDPALFTR